MFGPFRVQVGHHRQCVAVSLSLVVLLTISGATPVSDWLDLGFLGRCLFCVVIFVSVAGMVWSVCVGVRWGGGGEGEG